ncbi:MAG: enoyl-CoA hydratase, partial [Desulfobacca sp.]|nr:enoyl-CoA hydratase [Desulfobacca sp.]
EELETEIGLVTLNRPEKLNAINVEMVEDFEDLFSHLSRDESIRVLIITGKGRGFCAGADLSEVSQFQDSDAFSTPESFLRLVQERYSGLILGLRNIPQPVIAAVNGPAAGGGMALAMGADIRLASTEAYFVASFINIGLSGGEMGSSYLLPRLVGLSRAADILLTGRKVKADEAERIGLISKVVPGAQLIQEALTYARMMINKTVGGLKLTKRVLDQNLETASLAAGINLENRNQAIMLFSGPFLGLIQSFSKTGDGGDIRS